MNTKSPTLTLKSKKSPLSVPPVHRIVYVRSSKTFLEATHHWVCSLSLNLKRLQNMKRTQSPLSNINHLESGTKYFRQSKQRTSTQKIKYRLSKRKSTRKKIPMRRISLRLSLACISRSLSETIKTHTRTRQANKKLSRLDGPLFWLYSPASSPCLF